LGLLLAPGATFPLLLHGAAGLAGLGPSHFLVDEANFSRLRLSRVTLEQKGWLAADTIAVDFGRLGLLSGIKAGAIDGLRIRVDLQPAGGTPSSSARPPRLPALRVPFPLRLTNTEAELTSGTVRFTAKSAGEVVLHDGAAGRFDLAAEPSGRPWVAP